jgi:hypothetical protein
LGGEDQSARRARPAISCLLTDLYARRIPAYKPPARINGRNPNMTIARPLHWSRSLAFCRPGLARLFSLFLLFLLQANQQRRYASRYAIGSVFVRPAPRGWRRTWHTCAHRAIAGLTKLVRFPRKTRRRC